MLTANSFKIAKEKIETIKMYVQPQENKYIHITSPHTAKRNSVLLFCTQSHRCNTERKGNQIQNVRVQYESLPLLVRNCKNHIVLNMQRRVEALEKINAAND